MDGVSQLLRIDKLMDISWILLTDMSDMSDVWLNTIDN